MTHYHVVVVGAHTEKVGGKYADAPEQNKDLIASTIAKVPADSLTVYHTTNSKHDSVTEQVCFDNHIKAFQFPAYWFDPTKEGNRDKSAGFRAMEAAIRTAKDSCYNKQDTVAILLAFGKDTLTEHAVDFATKKGLTVRTYNLPVVKADEATATTPQTVLPF